jgi:hypothetical protein
VEVGSAQTGVAEASHWLLVFISELRISIADPQVWFAMAVAIALAAGCLTGGMWLATRVGILPEDSGEGERVGVGLAVGLLVLAAGWAAVASLGRSAFTPVAVGLAVATLLAYRRRTPEAEAAGAHLHRPGHRVMPSITGLVGVAVFVSVVGLGYGATISPSPRNGTQPVEFFDMAYYAVLANDLEHGRTESIFSPSGFDTIPGTPKQTWYHWGEIWLAAAVQEISDVSPLFARHYVVLPLLLLAAAALTGALVRRLTRTSSLGAFVFGAACCLFLAPVPVFLPGSYFGSWARSLHYGITLYGLGAVLVLLSIYVIATAGDRRDRATSAFAGAVIAGVVPAHIVLAVLGAVGSIGVAVLTGVVAIARRRGIPRLPAEHRTTLLFAVAVTSATVVWGLATGHGLGATGPSQVISAFHPEWVEAIVLTAIGGGVFWTIPIAWLWCRQQSPITATFLLAVCVLVVAGAVVWGARAADFNTFHVFYGALAAYAAPAAAVAIWIVWTRWRARSRRLLATALMGAFAIQMEFGVVLAIPRLQAFGPALYPPTPTAMLNAIGDLPNRSKLAYACKPFGEFAFWDPHLVTINAHTGQRAVPLCFQADMMYLFFGGAMAEEIPSGFYALAPQRAIYPTSTANPSPSTVTAFLRRHDIDYVYADPSHPNTLIPDADLLVEVGDWRLYRVP